MTFSLGRPAALWPLEYGAAGASIGSATYVLDAAEDKAALVFSAPKSGTIDKIGFAIGAFTTGALIECEMQSVGSDGNPTGSRLGSSTTGVVDTASESAPGWAQATLSTGAAVSRGDVVAAVVAQPASDAGNLTVGSLGTVMGATSNLNWPAGRLDTGSWAAQGTAPIIAVGYSDGSWAAIPYIWPIYTVNTNLAVSTSTSPDEVGNRFEVGAACSFVGIRIRQRMQTGNSVKYLLYDSADNVLSELTFDTDWSAYSSNLSIAEVAMPAAQLSPGETYRIAAQPQTGTALTFCTCDVDSADLWSALGGGAAMHYTARADAGAWSDVTTRRLLLTPLLDDFATGGGAAIDQEEDVASIVKGSTDITRTVLLKHASTGQGLTGLTHETAGLAAHYWRPGAAAPVEIPLASQTVDGAHTDGGFVELDATDMPGCYRIDLPDAFAAVGVDLARLTVAGAANLADYSREFELLDGVTTVGGAVESYPSAGALEDIQGAAQAGAGAALDAAEPLDANVTQFSGNPISGTGKSGDPVTAVP